MYYVFILFIIIYLISKSNFIFTVPGATITDSDFKILNNTSDWAVPFKWEIQSLAERDRIGKEVKKYYFNGKTISWNTVNELVPVSIFNHNTYEVELNY